MLKSANVEDDRMTLLTCYKDCMLNKFKANQKEAKTRKDELKDRLAKGLSIINGEVHKIGAYNTYIDHVVYDLSGYLIHARRKRIENCKECMDTLITKEDIPNDSEYPDNLVILRDKGGLKKVTQNFFF